MSDKNTTKFEELYMSNDADRKAGRLQHAVQSVKRSFQNAAGELDEKMLKLESQLQNLEDAVAESGIVNPGAWTACFLAITRVEAEQAALNKAYNYLFGSDIPTID